MSLQGRNILLGVTGGIAAYKTPEIVRLLTAEGAEVRVVLTRAAGEFVAPKTLEVLSRHVVYSDLFGRDAEFPVLHVGLAEWADLILVAPATAHCLGRVAGGLADDLLTSVLLCADVPVLLAPSMEENMLANAAVEANVQTLAQRGFHLLDPGVGPLASGAVGRGRMPEPVELIAAVAAHFSGDLDGLKLLVTAGPTVEDLDPVRFISNRSSGKMGYAIAERAAARGARVWLVSGPTALSAPAGVEREVVRSTLDMQRAVEALFEQVDGAILAAAPADYRAKEVAEQKIKRGAASQFHRVGRKPGYCRRARSAQGPAVAGRLCDGDGKGAGAGAGEAGAKGGDLIVLNMLNDEGAGFAGDTNRVTLIDVEGQEEALPLLSKSAVADRILDWVRARRGV